MNTHNTSQEMSQEQAQFLFEQGATFVFLDVPKGTEFGIDYNSWEVGDNFKGVKMIPPGIHFIYYSAVDKTGVVAPRTGFMYDFKKKEILIKKWDKITEDISNEAISCEEKERIETNKQELDRYLGAYPYDNYKKWVSLTNHITSDLLDRLMPLCGRITSVSQLQSLPSNTQSRRLQAASTSQAAAATSQAAASITQAAVSTSQTAASTSQTAVSANQAAVSANQAAASVTLAAVSTSLIAASASQAAASASQAAASNSTSAANGNETCNATDISTTNSSIESPMITNQNTESGETTILSANQSIAESSQITNQKQVLNESTNESESLMETEEVFGGAVKRRKELLPDMKPIPGTEIRFTLIPHNEFPVGCSSSDVTRYSMDHSYILNNIITSLSGHDMYILGEIQFSFICFLIGQVFEGFEQWKQLVNTLCCCVESVPCHTSLFSHFISLLHYHINEIPQDFFVDIISQENFLELSLCKFFENLEVCGEGEGVGELKKKGERFRRHLEKRFQWDFGSETGEYAPVVVTL